MRHVAITALCVLFLACKKDDPQQAGVQVLVNYTDSFQKGCFVVRSVDPAKPDVELEMGKTGISLDGKKSPLKIAVLRRVGWPERVRFILTAHELNCDGLQVGEQHSVELDLSGSGAQPDRTQTLALVTPDGDNDGFIPTANGGRDCDDTSDQARPNRTDEVCDGLDNNCNGQLDEGLTPRLEYFIDGDGDGVGAGNSVQACAPPPGRVAAGGDCDDTNAARSPNKQELCNGSDDDCDGTTDEGYTKEWYGDEDGDGFGAQSKLRVTCDEVVPGHVRVTGNNFDCDDGEDEVKPGAEEKCNNRDDNCVGGIDEPFLTGERPKGGDCFTDVCNGDYICDPMDDTRTTCSAAAPRLYYPDVDMDGEGAEGATAQKVCSGDSVPTGKVDNATDCDDVDPGTKKAAAEVCDGLDNNCDGKLDEGLTTCGGVFLQVFDGALGGVGHDWRTVAVDPVDGYPVWVAGIGGKLAVRSTVNTPFVSHSFGDSPPNSTNCGDHDWYAAWVRHSDGHVFLAGEGGRVAEHTGTACTSVDTPGSANLTGIWGFDSGSETTLYLVSDGGKLFTWTPGSTPTERHNNAGYVYKDIHALDPNVRLLVAGRMTGSPGGQAITSYVNGTLTTDSAHSLSNTVGGSVNALWMGSPSFAYAVGEGSAVWRWNGVANWTLVTPPGAGINFSSVVVPPGTNVAYIVDKGTPSKLRRLTPFGWARAPRVTPAGSPVPVDPALPLYDLAMTSVGDFWMVGDDGMVYHYPQP